MMRRPNPIAIVLLLIVLLSSCSLFQKSESVVATPLPAYKALQEEIQGQTPEQVYNTIVSFFGEPDRDVGMSLWLPQWDIDGGVLTYSPIIGPTFKNREGIVVYLLVTENEAGANILGSYEMFAAPDAYNTRYWLGNLELYADGTYEFIESTVGLDRRNNQENNFLLNNLDGKFAIIYQPGITENTLLENLENHALLAVLEFRAETAGQGSVSVEQFSVRIEGRTLHLDSSAYDVQPYFLYKAWEKFWNYKSGQSRTCTAIECPVTRSQESNEDEP